MVMFPTLSSCRSMYEERQRDSMQQSETRRPIMTSIVVIGIVGW
jgi:hypothetical protein